VFTLNKSKLCQLSFVDLAAIELENMYFTEVGIVFVLLCSNLCSQLQI